MAKGVGFLSVLGRAMWKDVISFSSNYQTSLLKSYQPSSSNGFHLAIIQISQMSVEFSPAVIQILQMCKIPRGLSSTGVEAYTDKKENEIFLIYKEI